MIIDEIKSRTYDALVKQARAVSDLAALVKLPRIKGEAFFHVKEGLFVWMPSDSSPEDGKTCVRRQGAPADAPGRYRVVNPVK